MLFKKIVDIILCPCCGKDSVLQMHNTFVTTCCNTEFKIEENQILIFDDTLFSIPEVRMRDDQAESYLIHSKFPTQISRMNAWMSNIPRHLLNGVMLDLGCGPGPTTKMLLEVGASNILSVDFSINSLRINKDMCQTYKKKPIYVLQDIRNLRIKEGSVSVLVMADFLQHIVNGDERKYFLKNIFKSLVPGGCFFLSFFNINIKHYFKKDISGSFNSGAIKYERLNYKAVMSCFPEDIIVEKIIPMNISHNAFVDKILSFFPFSHLLSRMIVIQGRKKL
tara:strand:- start:95 stop:931 length:837 start_codon:yes stop_codon:yes gene_type:complete